MIDFADIVVGLCWGDCGKGKLTSHLSATGGYNIVARWAGGNNAGHTVYVNGKKYKTNLIPSGVFHGILSVIGAGCVLHPESFFEEIEYLKSNGFDTSLIKVSANCHIVLDEHIQYDKEYLAKELGTTAKGIAPAYASKAARTGKLAKDILPKELIWDGKLSGKLLCEGAQGVWLDVNHGNYPYVTSSETLPYAACSIGFPHQKINKIYGVAKIYDTRSGQDPMFPESLFDNEDLSKLGELGKEFGVVTGRRRKVNWLNLDYLIKSINLTGTTNLIINKCDVMEQLGIFRIFHNSELIEFNSLVKMKKSLVEVIYNECDMIEIENIKFSESAETV